MVAQAAEDDADSTNVRLLSDVRDVFADMPGVTFLKSDALCTKLHEITDAPWRQYDLNPSKLGRRLREYQIKTGWRDSYKTERGYRLDDFIDAFERYLPSPETDDGDGFPAGKPSEGVRSCRNGSDLYEQSDGFKSSDALKVSDTVNPSEQNSRPNSMRTPSDSFGHHSSRKPVCPGCSRAPARSDTGLCDLCTARASKQDGVR
jgi:hypothetical protein